MYGANSEQKMLQMFYWETLQNPVIDLSSPNYRTINQKIDFLPFWRFLTMTFGLGQYFQTLSWYFSRLPGIPDNRGVNLVILLPRRFTTNPCETTMNTNIQAPPGDPVETTDFRTFHMNIIWLIIKTAISQLSSHNTDLWLPTMSRRGLTNSQTQKNLHFIWDIFFLVQSFITAKGWEV